MGTTPTTATTPATALDTLMEACRLALADLDDGRADRAADRLQAAMAAAQAMQRREQRAEALALWRIIRQQLHLRTATAP